MEATFHSLTGSQAVVAWIFIIIGALAICFALFFLLIIRYSLFKGLGIVLFATGIFQAVCGSYLLYISPNLFAPETSSFTWLSFGIMFSGGILLRLTSQNFWRGVGIGLSIQGCLSLVLLMLHAGELQRHKQGITQQVAELTKCRKKIDE